MRTPLILVGFVVAIALALFASPAGAGPAKAGCPTHWQLIAAASPDAVALDRNGDGWVCYKVVPGKGNGDYLISNAVGKDNNNP